MLPQVPILNQNIEPPALILKQEKEPEEKLYTIKEKDTLTKIAQENSTTVERLWEKNTDLTNPDLIEPNKQLKIPRDDEQLLDRPLPVAEPVIQPQNSPQRTMNVPRGSSAGNGYTPGYCTYGVKQWRPDIPNNLGNADTWFSRAANQGMAVGYTPRPGAVAAAIGYMHVALVLEVQGDKVLIKEMNYGGLWKVSTRLAPASEFRYIY